RMADFLRHISGARSVTSRRYIFVVGLSAALTCSAQTKTPVRGGMNAELTVLSLEPSIAFYQNVLGLEAPIARFSPALPGVGQLTGTITGGIRLARMPV